MGCRQAATIRAIPHTEGATRRGDNGKLEGEGRSPSTAGLERWRRSAARPARIDLTNPRESAIGFYLRIPGIDGNSYPRANGSNVGGCRASFACCAELAS
jgi:hypothetical protein